ncbi:hypothetical protein BC937DRAFT_94565 [Endogone sp. FLAS-F59071]|nr:hypothetical protein BC937DRAFT_94565 [Endogone sp. FLAS-F59071]|eukprot:RUS13948.1 hypothetical protein BC937DRAFT_94565 [Endogone sp. FLAS-F59071]
MAQEFSHAKNKYVKNPTDFPTSPRPRRNGKKDPPKLTRDVVQQNSHDILERNCQGHVVKSNGKNKRRTRSPPKYRRGRNGNYRPQIGRFGTRKVPT